MLMEIGMEKTKGDKETLSLDIVTSSMSENCRCNELEERSKKVEIRCAELEFMLQQNICQCEALETKIKALEVENFQVKGELEVLRVSCERPKKKKVVGNPEDREVETIIDLTDDNEVVQLMIENSVLECEKKQAQSEVELWKDKYKELESLVIQLELRSGSDYCDGNGKEEESNQIIADGSLLPEPILDPKVHAVRKVRKQLSFNSEESPSKKMAPCTPVNAKSASVIVIDVIDSDDELNIAAPDSQSNRNNSVSKCIAEENGKMSSSYAQNNEEGFDFGDDLPFVATPKRKRNCNVVTSESEHDEDDDDVPICKLKRMHIQEVSPDKVRCDTNSSPTASTSVDYKVTSIDTPRRQLMPSRKCARKSEESKRSYRANKSKHQQSIPTNDDESEEDLSDDTDEGLNDFIVDDTSSESHDVSNGDAEMDSSNSQDVSDNDTGSDSEDVSDEDMDLEKIFSQIQRRKDHMEWEFEADMLAAFGKNSELCMKAVCALYQQQTSTEQMCRETLHSNRRGFNKFDAQRGSTLAEFLTDGNPRGGLKKSVKELQEYDRKAVELCRTLAIRYSKQLYNIYKNKEDPSFP